MYKKTIIASTLTLFTCFLNAQTVTTKAEVIDLHYGHFPEETNPGAGTFKFDASTAYTIHTFDKIEISTQKIGDKEEGKPTVFPKRTHEGEKVTIFKTINVGSTIYMFGMSIHKNELVNWTAYKVDCANMKVEDIGHVFDSYTAVKGDKQEYSYTNVNDEAILVTKKFRSKGEGYKYELIMLDKDLNQLWRHEIKPPVTNTYRIEDYFFRSENDFLISVIEYTESGKNPPFKMRLFHYMDKMQKVEEYEVKMDGKFITDLTLGFNKEGQVVCAGFYSNKDCYSLSGCFYKLIDPSKKAIIKETSKEFDAAFNKSLVDRRQQRKNNDDMSAPDFDLRDLYFDADGNMLLVGEDYYAYKAQTSNSSWSFFHNYEDIVACGINASGEIKYYSKIEKKQSFGMPMKETFAIASVKDKWAMIFTQTLKSLKAEQAGEEIKKEWKSNDSAPVLVLIEPDGKYTKEALFIPDKKAVSATADTKFIRVPGSESYFLQFKDYKHRYIGEVKFKL